MSGQGVVPELVVVVRNGSFDLEQFHLNGYGHREMRRLALLLDPLVARKSAVLFSSTARYALEASMVLGSALGLPVFPEGSLGLNGGSASDPTRALEMVRVYRDKDVLILLSHLEFVRLFPPFFAGQEWGMEIPPIEDVPNGGGLAFNNKLRTVTLLK